MAIGGHLGYSQSETLMSNTFIHKSLNLSLKQLRMCANESRIPGPKSMKYLKPLDTYCQWPSSSVGRFPFPYTFTTTEHSHLEKSFHLVDNDDSILKFGVFTTNKVFIFIGLLYFFHFELSAAYVSIEFILFLLTSQTT